MVDCDCQFASIEKICRDALAGQAAQGSIVTAVCAALDVANTSLVVAISFHDGLMANVRARAPFAGWWTVVVGIARLVGWAVREDVLPKTVQMTALL